MTVEESEQLADCLVGMEDARKVLVKVYTFRQEGTGEGTAYSREMREAAERWHKAFNDLADFLDDIDS